MRLRKPLIYYDSTILRSKYYGISVNWLTIPNAFTYLRVLMTPFILLRLSHGAWMSGGWLLGAAAFTDFLDGETARRFGWHSKVGVYLDPVADKILLTCVYIGLAIAGAVPIWLLALILGRDIWILTMSAIALRFTKYRELNPSRWGKWSTFAQIMAAVCIIGVRAYGNPIFSEAAGLLVWVVAALAVISGVDYTWRGIAYLRGGQSSAILPAANAVAVDREQSRE